MVASQRREKEDAVRQRQRVVAELRGQDVALILSGSSPDLRAASETSVSHTQRRTSLPDSPRASISVQSKTPPQSPARRVREEVTSPQSSTAVTASQVTVGTRDSRALVSSKHDQLLVRMTKVRDKMRSFGNSLSQQQIISQTTHEVHMQQHLQHILDFQQSPSSPYSPGRGRPPSRSPPYSSPPRKQPAWLP